jgi:hypothetical protein
MANKKHIRKLREGAIEWNKWKSTLDITPDLSGAMFIGMNLNGYDLSGVNLAGADLRKVQLTAARVEKANLSGTDCRRLDLSCSILNGANLSHAKFAETVFGKTDLSNAVGLDTCIHIGPSTIDFRTIEISWPLPKVFLQGCGLPDGLINLIPTLTKSRISLYSCFISYSHKDEKFVKKLHKDLQEKGIRCWFAPEDMKIGDKIRPTIDNAIMDLDLLLIVLSENSIESNWVEKEVETAFEKEQRRKQKVFFPIRVDKSVMETDKSWASDIRRTRHIGDFSMWKKQVEYNKALDRLVRDLTIDRSVDENAT